MQEELKQYDAKIQELLGDQQLNTDDLEFEIGSNELIQALSEADDNG